MMKKLMITGLGSALAVGLLIGTNTMSYVTTGASQLQESMKNSVPVEFEIERARKMITDLTPEIRRNMHLIAKEEVEVERLASRVEELDQKLATSKNDIMRLKNDLDGEKTHYTYAGHTYTRGAVQTDLTARFARFKTQDATREKLGSILSAREQGLQAAREKLDAMLAARRQLEVDVENLEARQKMVEVAQTTSNFAFDDSQLSRTKRLVDEIRTRIEVTERMIDSEGQFVGEINLDEQPASEISDEVAAYFGIGAVEAPTAEEAPEINLADSPSENDNKLSARLEMHPSLN